VGANQTLTINFAVKPKQVKVTGVKITYGGKTHSGTTKTNGKVGDSWQMVAEVLPSNATNKGVTWSSSNTKVATVDSSSGKVTAKGIGTATITAKTKQSGVTATCKVTVVESIDVPANKGTSILFMGYHTDTDTSAPIVQLRNHARNNGRYAKKKPEYYAMIDNRIVIATMANIGGKLKVKISDYVDVTFKPTNGNAVVYKCIIGEVKKTTDTGADAWGHSNGANVVEIVYHDYSPPSGYNANKNDPWGAGKVTKITKVGGYGNYN
jgi:hypothetical protein